ncbi:MAG: GNAT family N-acetyltransferase [Sphingobium sp.]
MSENQPRAYAEMTFSIRRAYIEDAHTIAELKLTTFREAFLEDFAIPYPAADLAHFEAASYGPAKIATELSNPLHATWVADDGDMLLAYAHVGPCKLPHRDVQPNEGELYQIYVRRSAQGSRLGGQLLDISLEWLGNNTPGAIWLGAWAGNARAHAIYSSRGFVKVGEYEFAVGDWNDREFIFRRGRSDKPATD